MSTKATPSARRPVGRPGDGEDVRGDILSAALRQLEATGSPERVTVAAIVGEAGCTPPSLYHYWPRRELLLHEASAVGWAQFRASQAGAVADRLDPLERLRLRGRAYLRFALAKPALFRVLFLEAPVPSPPESPAQTGKTGKTGKTVRVDKTSGAGNTGEAGEALSDLVADVTAAMATGQIRPADPLTTALALWATMHGVAALWAVTPGLPAEVAHAVGDLAQDAVIFGLAAKPGTHGA